jgi:DNA-directed RNA polymerase alpha subunit
MSMLPPQHSCHIYALLKGKQITRRVYNVLKSNGIYDIRVAKQIPDSRFLKLPNFGRRSLREIKNLILSELI